MLRQAKNNGRPEPFYPPPRAGGRRDKHTSSVHRRLVAISKCMSGASRHRKLPGMTDEGWVPVKVLLSLRGMLGIGATFEGVHEIAAGGGDNNKFRFELSMDRSRIRCAQGHSVGSGVRPDCLPVATNVKYSAHGTRLEAAQLIAKEGSSRRQRLHIHLYEWGRCGNVLDGHNARCGSDVAIAIDARQCMDGGIVFYR